MTLEILRYPDREGIARLITNSGQVRDIRPTVPDTSDSLVLTQTRAYLRQVFEGDGVKSYCPFASSLEQNNAYRVIENNEAPNSVDLEAGIARLKRDFTYLSPGMTEQGKPFDLTSLVMAFGHEAAVSSEFLEAMQRAHAEHKMSFLKQGRMLGYMHPLHVLGSQRSSADAGDQRRMFNASLPLLVVRRMHASDSVLLRKPEELEMHRKIYAS